MKNFTFTHVSAILVTMALSVLFNACSKSGPEGGGSTEPVSGGGGGDASLQLKMECTFENPVCYRLVATTAKSIAKYDKFFEIDTNPNPRVRYDCERNYDRSFTSGFLGVLPVSEGRIYCRAVVAKDKDTTRSEVVSFDAVAGFPFLESFEGVAKGDMITVRGRFGKENFDISKLEKMTLKTFYPSDPTKEEQFCVSDFDRICEDGRFTSSTGTYEQGTNNPDGNCILHVQYTYDGLTYVHPVALKFHIDAEPVHHFFESKIEKYMVETFGSDGKLTELDDRNIDGVIDIRGLGVETVDDFEMSGNRAKYLYIDNNPIEYVDLLAGNREVLTCSDCKNLTRIDLGISSGKTAHLSRLDVHGCTKLKTIGARRSSKMLVDTLICYSCNLTELPEGWKFHKALDCHDNRIESIRGRGIMNVSHNILKNLTMTPYAYEIDCSYNLLEELDISMCEELERLDCSHNELLTTVYVNAAQMENPGFIVKDEHTQLVLKQ